VRVTHRVIASASDFRCRELRFHEGGGGEPPKTEVVAEHRGGADRRDGGGAVASSVGGLMSTIATAPPIEVRV
jgi:hypothetical protein